MRIEVEIITTAHWEGDPRLNRHVAYLDRAGHGAVIISCVGQSRWRALMRAIGMITRSRADVVLLPDPELFVVGSLAARLSGKRAVIDIHEDYAKTAFARPWVPTLLRPLVAAVARASERVGRWAAWRTMVAAPELKRPGDYLATNIADPSSLDFAPFEDSRRLVYIGDVTEARGASMMIETLAAMPPEFELTLIGHVGPEVRAMLGAYVEELDVASRLQLVGRQPHAAAWERAGGALAGLNFLQDVPAYRATVGTKLWEYMAVGLPPVVTDLPGQRSVIAQIDAELVCAGPSDAAVAIARLAADPERRRRLGEEFRAFAERAWADSRPDRVVASVVEP